MPITPHELRCSADNPRVYRAWQRAEQRALHTMRQEYPVEYRRLYAELGTRERAQVALKRRYPAAYDKWRGREDVREPDLEGVSW